MVICIVVCCEERHTGRQGKRLHLQEEFHSGTVGVLYFSGASMIRIVTGIISPNMSLRGVSDEAISWHGQEIASQSLAMTGPGKWGSYSGYDPYGFSLRLCVSARK